MFDGLDAFDMDPDQIQDLYGPGMSQFNAGGAVGAAVGASGPPMGPPPGAIGGAQQGVQGAQFAPGVASTFQKIGAGLSARSEAKMAAHQMQLQGQLAKGQISQQVFEAEMQRLLARGRPGAMSSYGVLIVLGGVVLVGVAAFYMMRKKGR